MNGLGADLVSLSREKHPGWINPQRQLPVQQTFILKSQHVTSSRKLEQQARPLFHQHLNTPKQRLLSGCNLHMDATCTWVYGTHLQGEEFDDVLFGHVDDALLVEAGEERPSRGGRRRHFAR